MMMTARVASVAVAALLLASCGGTPEAAPEPKASPSTSSADARRLAENATAAQAAAAASAAASRPSRDAFAVGLACSYARDAAAALQDEAAGDPVAEALEGIERALEELDRIEPKDVPTAELAYELALARLPLINGKPADNVQAAYDDICVGKLDIDPT
jgi:hypothetical protein